MTSRKTTSADTAQCSTTSHDAATDALAMSVSIHQDGVDGISSAGMG